MRCSLYSARVLRFGIALAALASSGCLDCRTGGLFCGAEGTPAPEPRAVLPSACQPRAVMPRFFALIDSRDPSLAGLRVAVADLARPVCLLPQDRGCISDDQCAVGLCKDSLCPCQTSYSPLADLLGIALRGMATIATDELRRTIDVLVKSGGANVLGDLKRVVLALLDYAQGKTDGKTHYDLFAGIGRAAGAQTAACDPAAPWQMLDAALGQLTSAVAARQLSHLKTLLMHPYTRQFLAGLSYPESAQGRDSWIVLVHAIAPSITNARSGSAALDAVAAILHQVTSGAPQDFIVALDAVLSDTRAMLGDSAGIFAPLQAVLRCAGSTEVRCPDSGHCTTHDDELVGAFYDLLSRPEQVVGGGLDLTTLLTTLVGALESLVTLDRAGEVLRTLRLVVQGIEGSPDPNDPHEARDAAFALAKEALTAEEGARLVPALSVLLENGVVLELFTLLQDLLSTCKPR